MTSIIPEKPNLFSSRTYESQIIKRQSRPIQQIRKQEEKIKEEEPIFDVPIIDQPKLTVQSPPVIQIAQKKIGWRKWVVVVFGSIIVIGLGAYFLLG